MVIKPKLNQPDVKTTTTFTGESITINMTIPTKQFKDIFVTGTSVIDQQSNPTLSECIKEWKTRRWKVEILKDEKNKDISIYGTREQSKYYYEMFKVSAKLKVMSLDGVFTLDMIYLLINTLKALEVENDTR